VPLAVGVPDNTPDDESNKLAGGAPVLTIQE
jgi:hypothetical protein